MDWAELALIVFGSSGIASIVAQFIQRKDEHHRFWRRDKQALFAEAMRYQFQISERAHDVMLNVSVGQEPPESESEWMGGVIAANEDLRKQIRNLEQTYSSIRLLAPDNVKLAVYRFVALCEQFSARAFQHVSDRAQAESLAKLAKQMSPYGDAMEDAFKKDLGVESSDIVPIQRTRNPYREKA